MKNKTVNKYIILLLFCVAVTPAYTQGFLKNIKDKASTVVSKVATTDVLGSFLKQPDPITTSFNDVDITASLDSTFGNNEKYLPFDTLDFCPEGFVLQPGFFEATLQSFCLRAGTPSPTKGNGYMNAPLQGPMAVIVNHIVWNYPFYPEVTQRDVQVLLWAIIAKTPYTDYGEGLKQTVNILLSPNDVKLLKKAGAEKVISDAIFNNEIVKMPKELQAIFKAENELRKLAKSGSSDFDTYERLAMIGGIVADDKLAVSKGVWTYVKEKNYYVRYFPQGYRKEIVQLYVPERKSPAAVGHGPFMPDLSAFSTYPDCYDPSGNLLNPPGMNMQRLICTYCNDNGPDTRNALEKMLTKLKYWKWGGRINYSAERGGGVRG